MDKSKISLPIYLDKLKTASVNVYSLVLDTAPDIAICNSDGYFLEIKGKKILSSLNLNKEIGNDMKYFYFCANEKPFIIYVVQTKNKKLILIKRQDSRVEIMKTYEEIENYEVDDFMLFGYPQLKIYKQKIEYLVQFPIFDTDEAVDQLDFETNLSSIAKLFAEKLQIVCRHVDELTEEWHGMKRLVQLKNCQENFNLIPVNSVKFPLPLKEYAEKITVESTWIKMISDKLVLGINIFCDGEKKIPSLEFKIFGKLITKYSYRFFPNDDSELNFKENPLFSCKKINSSILPGQKITVVAAVLISFHNSLFERELQISCYLTSAEVKNYLIRKTFEINISDLLVFEQKFSSVDSKYSVEDLQAIKTVKSETKFKIKLKNYVSNTLENILKHNFGFKEVKYKEGKLYYCCSKYLREAFIAFQPDAVTEQAWKFNFYSSNETQIYFFANVLHELLPEYTRILLDED